MFRQQTDLFFSLLLCKTFSCPRFLKLDAVQVNEIPSFCAKVESCSF